MKARSAARALAQPTLEKYRKMRDFGQTAEPRGGAGPRKALGQPRAKPGLSYVIQKHAARRLHYDFRLELDGVLLSWAVPKGPSRDPELKRLAQETEPHPLEYGKFEGTIAKGQYGAGTVEIWDRGSWSPEGDARAGYAKGHLAFTLEGERLRGRWHLVKTKSRDERSDVSKSWLLFKSKDEHALSGDDAEQVSSKLSARDDEPEPKSAPRKSAPRKTAARKSDAPRKSGASRKSAARKSAAPGQNDVPPENLGRAGKLPGAVAPQLATLVEAAPPGEAWLHEIKLDGYRMLARIEQGEVQLLTRGGKDWTERMPELAAALSKLKLTSALLDGEVVALDERGVSNFQRLQGAFGGEREQPLFYYAFDLLHLNGRDLADAPLLERKAALALLLQAPKLPGALRLSEHVLGAGPKFFDHACKLGLEGIVSKRASAPYRAGRGRDWLKVKCSKRQELVIVGYTEPGGSRKDLGALLVGTRRDQGLVYSGRVGTGFDQRSLRELRQRLEPLRVESAPVENPPRGAQARGVHWVKPELVAEVSFTEITDEGLLRHPSFRGLREDKPAAEVRLERPAPVAPAYPLTHPEKVLYAEQGITKRELLDYYALVAERMLPHVANRPLTLVRCPEGQGKPCFFQKHPGKGTPPGLRSVSIREKEGKAPYSVIDDAQGLFGLVQLSALEIHTWGAAADDFEHANLLVFDLDPDPAVELTAVIECAHKLRAVFEAAKLESFVKTTGGKGLHVCLPIAPDLDWEQIKAFSGRLAEAIAEQEPERYVATQSKAKRKGKIFIDYLRNARGATFIAPYSTRARPGATLAVPLEWDELTPRIKPDQFTLRNIGQRLAKLARDPFERMAKLRQKLRPSAVGG